MNELTTEYSLSPPITDHTPFTTIHSPTMSIDNPGNFFSADNFNNDDDGESWKPLQQNANALFKKSIDILNITRTICDLLPDDEELTKGMMMENAMKVPAKIRGTMALEVYSIMMENAVIIKVNIIELKNLLWACGAVHGIEEKYTQVLEEEITAFKKIFISWITCFDKLKDLPDEWHIFNDPSSFPDDDEPFDANDFFENFNPDADS